MNDMKFHIYLYRLNNIQIKAFYNITCEIPKTREKKTHTHTLCSNLCLITDYLIKNTLF